MSRAGSVVSLSEVFALRPFSPLPPAPRIMPVVAHDRQHCCRKPKSRHIAMAFLYAADTDAMDCCCQRDNAYSQGCKQHCVLFATLPLRFSFFRVPQIMWLAVQVQIQQQHPRAEHNPVRSQYSACPTRPSWPSFGNRRIPGAP